jgi:hypothetical protein
VLPADALLALARALAFWTPAGLGVQEGGYALFLGWAWGPETAAAAGAFVLLKRGKEAVWILIGLALRAAGGPRRREEPEWRAA